MAARSKQPVHSLVIYAKDKRRVSTFYQRTLGVEPVERSRTHDLLRGRGIELVIHAIPRKYAKAIEVTRPPAIREETPLKPAFVVKDLDAVGTAAIATGGSLHPMSAAWRYGESVVLDGHDPEGNVVQFRQLSAGSS